MNTKHFFYAPVALAFFLAGCESPVQVNGTATPVMAVAETQPVESSDDAADDPAIWVHPENPEASLILGTDKRSGLGVYNLEGELVQFLNRGRLNNVDIRQNVPTNMGDMDIVVATNRTHIALDIFSIDNSGEVNFLLSQPLGLVDPYGVCMGLDSDGNAYAYTNDSETSEYQQWLLNPEGELSPELVGLWQLNSQPEGCAVHDASQTLYFGEENYGLWKMPADASRADEMSIIELVGNGQLVADIEGMDIYEKGSTRWLVVSSQGDYSYAIYDLNDSDAYLGSFRVVDNPELGIDGSEETDGLTLSSAYLGERYGQGMLVVQDGFNRLPNDNQNFKIISWESIMDAFGASQ